MFIISQNIKKIIHNEQISIRMFEQSIGCSNGVIGRCILKGTDISSVWLSKIIEAYPQYNARWLLTGKGNMILSSQNKEPIKIENLNIFIDKKEVLGDCKKIEKENGQLKLIIAIKWEQQ